MRHESIAALFYFSIFNLANIVSFELMASGRAAGATHNGTVRSILTWSRQVGPTTADIKDRGEHEGQARGMGCDLPLIFLVRGVLGSQFPRPYFSPSSKLLLEISFSIASRLQHSRGLVQKAGNLDGNMAQIRLHEWCSGLGTCQANQDRVFGDQAEDV
jgi:hypothetical protein